jgi:hypothetical protein
MSLRFLVETLHCNISNFAHLDMDAPIKVASAKQIAGKLPSRSKYSRLHFCCISKSTGTFGNLRFFDQTTNIAQRRPIWHRDAQFGTETPNLAQRRLIWHRDAQFGTETPNLGVSTPYIKLM